MKTINKGKFFVIEGVDGSGKSTQVQKLKDTLTKAGLEFHLTTEPTERPIGLIIRDVLTKKLKVSSHTLAGLFLADRLDHLENETDGIIKLINEGTHVISDRYYWSSYAYNSLGTSVDWVIGLNEVCSKIKKPDITFYLDLTADESIKRIKARNNKAELFEKHEILEKVRKNYLYAINKLKGEEEIVIIDAAKKPDDVFAKIWEVVREKIR